MPWDASATSLKVAECAGEAKGGIKAIWETYRGTAGEYLLPTFEEA